ncbi:MAG: 3'-5' exonuclease, partial [Oscillospiraceae bacterium]
EEERRLCYVGITRAKSRLFISRAQTRTLFGATKFNAESRFISEIPKELIDRIAIKKKDSKSAYASGENFVTFDNSSMLKTSKTNKSTNIPTVRYSVGEKVKHRKFGVGEITYVQEMGADSLLKIQFKGTSKNLMAAYANLEKME